MAELVAPGTVNTMPEATLHAFADHGVVRGDTIRPYYDDAHAVLAALADLGISFPDVVEVLEREGVEKFVDSWNQLLTAIGEQLATAGSRPEALAG